MSGIVKPGAGLAALVFLLAGSCAPREGAKSAGDGMMVIAVGQPGTVLNAVGTGVAKLVTEESGRTMRVRVTSGMDALVGSGDAEIGVSASDSAHLSSNGLRHYEGRPQRSLRLLLPGPPLVLGFLVRADAPYRELGDLRGARVAGEFPNARPMHFDGKAMLSLVGLTWSDLDVVPVASFRDGIQAFVDGRVEATIGSVGSGLTQQADASLGGVRFVSLPREADVSERMWREEPGFRAVTVSSGFAVGVDEELVLAGKDTYVTAHADVSADDVHGVTELLWARIGELDTVHPLFARWSQETMSNPRVTIPFHDGAVRFLREVGVWSEEHQVIQEELLARLSR